MDRRFAGSRHCIDSSKVMNSNPFAPNTAYVNDLEDFKLPYRLVSKTDEEIMKDKYIKLRKSSDGYIVRLGIL